MRSITVIGFTWVLALAAGCTAQSVADPAGNEDVTDSATDELGTSNLPPEVVRALSSNRPLDAQLLDRLFKVEHLVTVGTNRKIHVTETFSLRAWLRWPHRGLLLLPGPLTKGDFFNIDVDGYRGRDLIASRGFFAVTADYEGSGLSTYPADGRSPSQDLQIAAMKQVIRHFAAIRLIPKMDVLGESWGGGVAAELCADRIRVKSCTLGSMLYRTPSDFANMTFRSPGFRAFLDSLPDGYFPTTPDVYLGITANSPPAVQAWTAANQPGRYTTVPLYDVFDLPFFDPTIARVPGRIIQGELDPNQSLADARDLARDYDGHGAELVVISGAGHIPRIEPRPRSDQYWQAVTNFIDP